MPSRAPHLLPTSLTGRLVATLVLVVVLSSAVVTVVTSLALRSALNDQLDSKVNQALGRTVDSYNKGFPTTPPDDGDRRGFGAGDATGTLAATLSTKSRTGTGSVLTSDSTPRTLSSTAKSDLGKVPRDGRVHTVELPGVGSFRVRAVGNSTVTLIAGVSTRDYDRVIAQVILYEVLLTLGVLVLAGATGRVLVRRQLRPLRDVAATAHEVAGLPLSSGEIGTTVRVPDDLTDERTEVGSVGAALNTLLEHVEHALDDRHRSEQQVRQFVADASHELRTPLSTIHGYAELTRRTSPGDPAQLEMAMGKVEAAATRMSSLVEDLLLLARLDAGRPLARDEVDVTRLVLETVGDARVVAPGHRWLLDLPDEPVTVPGDEQRLHQVVTNLLGNARRHTPPGTSVRVSVRPTADEVLVVVEDDGPGMSPDLVRTAFERFTRGDSSRTRESGGAGLGLSLVQAITSAHGGRVSVTSEPGATRFEVRLPSVAAEVARPPQAEPEVLDVGPATAHR